MVNELPSPLIGKLNVTYIPLLDKILIPKYAPATTF